MPAPEYCSTEGCTAQVAIRKVGLCKRHYDQQWRTTSAAYRAKRRRPHLQPRLCALCGKMYQPIRKDQRYCSPACLARQCRRARYYADVDASRAKLAREYKRRVLRRKAALLATWAPTPLPPLLPPAPLLYPECACCGQPMQGRKRKYCTPLCAAQAKRVMDLGYHAHRRAATPRLWVGATCPECGEGFIYNARMPATFCSTPCVRRNRRRIYKKRRNERIQAGARREAIDLAKLANRDGWRCHICKRKVTRKTWSHDHLVPLSAGGDHTWDNVALAHHRCNSRRSNTGAAQLRLTA